MYSKIDNEFINNYGKLFEFFLKIKYNFFPVCSQFNNEWQMNAFEDREFEKIFEETEKKVEQTHPKILRKTKKCIFFGETSSGKSTLVNATLGSDVLPEDFGSVSSCFVEIKSIHPSRTDKKSYLVVDGEEKEITQLDQLNNFQSENPLQAGSHIDLFYDSANCPMLRNDAVLIDTPGINKASLTDGRVEEYCNEADLIIVMVNSTSYLNETTKGFIDRLKLCLTKLNLAIVFNFWDKPDKRPSRERVKSQFTEEARQVLCGRLGYSIEEANERIHFLSAYERILFNQDNKKLQSRNRWESRNESFDRFNAFLQRQMEESSFERRYNYLCQLKETLISVLNKFTSVVSEMSTKIVERSDQIKEKFNDVKELEEEIKTSTTCIFQLAYDDFIEQALQLVKGTITPRPENEYKKLEEMDETKLINNKLEGVLDEIMKKSKEHLKANIKDCIRRTNDEYLPGRILFVENVYFPVYVDRISVEYKDEFSEIFDIIRKKIKLICGLTIAFTTLSVGAAAATGGVAGAILAPVDIAIGAIVGIGLGSAAIGATVAGTTSNAVVSIIKKPFQCLWNKIAVPIREAWLHVEKELCNSYGRFLNEIDLHLENNMLSLKEELNEIQNDLDNLTNEMIQFHNNVLLQ